MAYPVSDRWERFVRRGFTPITRVDVGFPGMGIVYPDLPVSSGSITFTRTQAVRGSGSIVVPDPTLFPALNNDSPIAPYGAELHIRTGILYPEGAGQLDLGTEELESRGLAELVPLGVFQIEDGGGSEKAGNVTSLAFADRAQAIDRMEHVRPKDFGGTMAFTALMEVILDPSPWLDGQMTWDVFVDVENLTDFRLPNGTTFDTGRWQFVEQICEALGAEAYFGRDGNAYIVPIPGITPENQPLDAHWILDSGEGGVLVDVDRGVVRPEANAVVMTGSADGDRDQPFAFVRDDNPQSRTYYGGPFGKVIKRFDNSDLTSSAQCVVAGKAKLRELTGLQRAVSVTTFGNSAMDPGDILLARVGDTPDEIHMLDTYTFDFASTAIDIETRSIQYVPD